MHVTRSAALKNGHECPVYLTYALEAMSLNSQVQQGNDVSCASRP